MADWIPITERLPDVDTVVLVHAPSASEPVWPAFINDDDDETRAHWFWVDGGYVEHHITHWQPFPEPPQGASAEQTEDDSQ